MGFSWENKDEAPGSVVRRPGVLILAFLLWTTGFIGALFGIWPLAITGILTGAIAASQS